MIEYYKRDNIYTIEVSEVENLFLIEPLIKLVANQIGSNPDETFSKVSEFLFKKMTEDKLDVVNAMCVKEIRHKLSCFSSGGKSEEEIDSDLHNMLSRIDVHGIFSKAETVISDIISKRDYMSMIRLYSNKGLCRQVGGFVGVKKPYPQVVLDLLKGEKRQVIITAIKEYLPKI